MAVSIINDASSFEEEVRRDGGPVLVAMRAAGCLPSQHLVPTIDTISERYDGRARVVAVDIDGDWRENEIMRTYGLTRLPVVMLLERGEVMDLIGGATTEDSVSSMVESRLKPVRDVGILNFEAEVLKEERPVLVHFHAAWCAQSLEIAPQVDSVAEKLAGRAKFVRVEFGGENAALCARYGVLRVPTLQLFERGEVKDQIMGALTGGAKIGARRTSCVNLTSFDNIAQMVEAFVRRS